MTGYESKRAAAQDKLLVTDIDGHVVRDARKPKKAALDRDAEIERLNEKIEFLARTNMLYSDWEHRETQVTSDLIRKGIEEAKINAELRAEIAELKAQLVAQPEEEKLHPVSIGVDVTQAGTSVTAFYRKPDAVMEMFYAQFHPMPHPAQEPVAYLCKPDKHGLFDFPTPDKACEDCFPVYTAPPQRPWVGLTDADIERIKLMTYEKETNADGEEQEAVNIDWLIKTTEHFCKEKNT